MEGAYELAKGGVRGREHRFSDTNYQDACCVIQTSDFTVAVVTDGCGSQRYSEVGAQLGVRIVAEEIAGDISSHEQIDWEEIQEQCLFKLRRVANACAGDDWGRFIIEYLLFTVIGVVIGPEESYFFGIGDGHVIVNGESIQIGPFEKNMPPYLAYGLLKSGIDPESLQFKIHRTLPTAELEHFLIGCDGVTDLERVAEKPIPRKEALVGSVSQFWTEDRYFKNPDNIRRWLTLVNGGINPTPGSGHLPDDTTFIVGRRRKEAAP